MDKPYPPTPMKGYMSLGVQQKQGTKRGWWIFASPKKDRVPVTITAGHEENDD